MKKLYFKKSNESKRSLPRIFKSKKSSHITLFPANKHLEQQFNNNNGSSSSSGSINSKILYHQHPQVVARDLHLINSSRYQHHPYHDQLFPSDDSLFVKDDDHHHHYYSIPELENSNYTLHPSSISSSSSSSFDSFGTYYNNHSGSSTTFIDRRRQRHHNLVLDLPSSRSTNMMMTHTIPPSPVYHSPTAQFAPQMTSLLQQQSTEITSECDSVSGHLQRSLAIQEKKKISNDETILQPSSMPSQIRISVKEKFIGHSYGTGAVTAVSSAANSSTTIVDEEAKAYYEWPDHWWNWYLLKVYFFNFLTFTLQFSLIIVLNDAEKILIHFQASFKIISIIGLHVLMHYLKFSFFSKISYSNRFVFVEI